MPPACTANGDYCSVEGRHYGCWFWPARGSGIYLNIGRSPHFLRRTEAAHGGFGTFVLTNRSRGSRKPLPLSSAWLDPQIDTNYAAAARLAGYDSIQVLHANGILFGDAGATSPASEIVLATDDCVKGTALTGPCLLGSSSKLLRRGLAASEPCACENTKHYALNCEG